MKTTLLATVAAASMFLATSQANAADVDVPVADSMSMYVSVFAGASFPKDIKTVFSGTPYSVDMKTGYLLGGAIGAQITDMVRGEVELSHSSWKAKSYVGSGGSPGTASGSTNATYLLANVWLDMQNSSAFTPYAGGGVGAAWVTGDVNLNNSGFGPADGRGTNFAFQLGAGVKYAFTDQVSLDLGYRYKSIQNVDFKALDGQADLENGDVNSHNIQLGLTYNF
jgi:opacity protein-like surface antigen